MNNILKGVALAAVSVSVVSLVLPAFASTPKFVNAAPGSGIAVDSFDPQVQNFNRADIGDLLRAKTVSVVRFDAAWTDGDDVGKAFDAVSNSDQSIHLLREGLMSNPAAVKLLAEHHIAINSVVDIVPIGNGAVQLYVS